MKKISIILFLGFFGVCILCGWYVYVNKKEQIKLQDENKQFISDSFDATQLTELSRDINESFSDKTVSIVFAGDMNFDRHIRHVGSKKGYDFILKDVGNLMKSGDCFVANLEGPLTNHDSVSIDSEIGSANNYKFTFNPLVAEILRNYNTCMVNIGNNHIHNFGDEGVKSTKAYLKNAKVSYFGDTGLEENDRTYIKKIKETKIAFANYNAFSSDAIKHINEDIDNLKENSDFVVVYTHWGVEFSSISRSNERDIAHQLIDRGADVIIGSHPHVVQESEKYNGKMIYYSLGNFIFDQYFQPETQEGLLVRVTFDKKNDIISFQENTIYMKNTGQTVIIKN